MAQALWVREFPEIGGKFRERADKIETEKRRLLEELAALSRSEAALIQEVAATGEWSRQEIGKALLKIDPRTLPFLPDRLPVKRCA
jgi:hypothetical protein